MSTTGNVVISIADNGGSTNVVVPAPTVVAIAGCSSGGTVAAATPYSTSSIATVIANSGYGPLAELAAMLIARGATLIVTRLTQSAAGTATSVTHTGTGTSVVTVTLDGVVGAYDTYAVKVTVPTTGAGTIGTSGAIQISLDAGRTTGPIISLGTANTYAIPHTGITLNFGVGTLVAGDVFTFGTVEPTAAVAGIQAWITALQNSPFAVTGWGQMVLVGDLTGANASTIETNLDSLAANYLFDRMICNARDAHAPTGYGAGETETTWMNALLADYSATTARRLAVSAGHYNMPSGIANSAAGTPRYRRPESWAIAARKVGKPVQVLSSRVKDGPLSSIVVDPTNDPTDGWIYHDERINPGLDAGRFMSAWTRLGQGQGFFVRSENLMSPAGSDFPLLAVGQCFDNFCAALVQYFTANIDSSTRTNANGTIYENDAQTLEKGAMGIVAASMPGQYQPANTKIVVDRSYNVKTNSKVLVTGTFGGLAYMREFDLTMQMQNPNAA